MNRTRLPMKSRIVLFILGLVSCAAAVSCRSSGAEAGSGGLAEFREFEGSISAPCMLVTPETLDDVPETVREAAEKFSGKEGTVVVVSALRPRYLRLIRQQGRILLGSVELNPSTGTVYLCVLSGIGEAAETVRSIKVENPDHPDPWDLGVFIQRYPDLAARLNDLPPGDERLEAASPVVTDLLRRSSTRIMLEKRAGTKDSPALEEARRAEAEQVAVLENILNSK